MSDRTKRITFRPTSEEIERAIKKVACMKDGGNVSRLINRVLDAFLKSEGCLPDNEETELFDAIREILADGHTAEEINEHLMKLGRKGAA